MPRDEGFKCNQGLSLSLSPNPPSDGDRAAISLLPFVPPPPLLLPPYLSLSLPSLPSSLTNSSCPDSRANPPSSPRTRGKEEEEEGWGRLPREVIRHTYPSQLGVRIPIPRYPCLRPPVLILFILEERYFFLFLYYRIFGGVSWWDVLLCPVWIKK